MTDTLILSDLHLGSDVCHAREAVRMLETQSFRRLILLGGVFLLFFRTAFNTHNERFYLRNHKHWSA